MATTHDSGRSPPRLAGRQTADVAAFARARIRVCWRSRGVVRAPHGFLRGGPRARSASSATSQGELRAHSQTVHRRRRLGAQAPFTRCRCTLREPTTTDYVSFIILFFPLYCSAHRLSRLGPQTPPRRRNCIHTVHTLCYYIMALKVSCLFVFSYFVLLFFFFASRTAGEQYAAASQGRPIAYIRIN